MVEDIFRTLFVDFPQEPTLLEWWPGESSDQVTTSTTFKKEEPADRWWRWYDECLFHSYGPRSILSPWKRLETSPLTNTFWHRYQFQFVYIQHSAEIRKRSTSKFIGSWLLGERGLFGTGAGITFFSISGKWKPTAEDSLFLARNWILKFWNGGRVEDSSNAILAVEELAAKRPISLWATDFQRNPVKNANDVSTETHKINVSSTL